VAERSYFGGYHVGARGFTIARSAQRPYVDATNVALEGCWGIPSDRGCHREDERMDDDDDENMLAIYKCSEPLVYCAGNTFIEKKTCTCIRLWAVVLWALQDFRIHDHSFQVA